MARVLVWDIPTRVLHGLLVIGFLAAFALAMAGGEEGAGFPVHMIVGVTLGLVVMLRVVWGVVGTRYARFGSFAFSPAAVAGYLWGVFRGRVDDRHTGHNPASAWMGLILLLLTAGVVATGLMMAYGSDRAEGPHGVLAWAVLVLGVVHLLGVVLHTVRHRENITMGMVNGTKDAEPGQAIASGRVWAGAGMLAAVLVFGAMLYNAWDRNTGTTRWPLIGTELPLGEPHERSHGNSDHERKYDRR